MFDWAYLLILVVVFCLRKLRLTHPATFEGKIWQFEFGCPPVLNIKSISYLEYHAVCGFLHIVY